MALHASTIVPWWKGARGEWYVLAQAGLFLLVAVGPHSLRDVPAWQGAVAGIAKGIGAALMAGGLAWIVAGIVNLGSSLSALPHPREEAKLVESGAFAFVRHPMYCGGIWVAAGWGLWTAGPLTLGYALLLAVFFDAKARREERWLRGKFPEYARYCRRVKRLIPFLY